MTSVSSENDPSSSSSLKNNQNLIDAEKDYHDQLKKLTKEQYEN